MSSNDQPPRRLTSKMEAFAQAVALKKQSLSACYAEAYDAAKMAPKSINDAASKLAAHPAVAQRIEVLVGRAEAAAVKAAAYTIEAAMGEAGRLLEDAKNLGQISAGVAAATLRARLSGLLAEKKEEKKGALSDLDVEGLLALRAELEAKLQREADALELAGASSAAAPVTPFRRVIG